ncbi:MAG: pseudouridine synthase, partial [Gammaproteobacteria bacterium]|nr:pseudouridine synthase [Gammaproteobacteria bacterium]
MRPFATHPAGSPAGVRRPPPCVIHEDDDLLVVAKPAGWNTHAPAAYAGEGIYEWLRHREPRWSSLAIVHRLDRDTSGVLVFARTPAASKSLTEQFTRREIRKRYLLLTDGTPPRAPLRVETSLVRSGARYAARPPAPGSGNAVTIFKPAGNAPQLVIAEPLTGRTHQVRVQAAMQGFAVRGDKLYGGGEAPRLCLHAEQITLRHPGSEAVVTYGVTADFDAEPGEALRAAFIDPQDTNALRLIHGAADGWPGCYVDRLADTLLIQSAA